MIIELGMLVKLLNVDNNSFTPVSKKKDCIKGIRGECWWSTPSFV